jgi:hypothetical protein
MPDDWELAHQLDPNNPDDRNLPGPNGYTMLETYLNQLVGSNPSTTTEVAKEASRPTQFALEQNYPNPFNPTTAIRFQLPAPSARQTANGLGVEGSAVSQVSLKVFDILGREIATLVNSFCQAGSYQITFNASHLSSGIYFYQLRADAASPGSAQSFVQTRKMILMK